MDVPTFLRSLPERYWQWGTMTAQPRGFDRWAAIIDDVRPMSSPCNLALLDHAVRHLEPGECYLEVGTWRGGTLIGALADNPNARGFAIDNDAMTEHNPDERASRTVWGENVERYGLAERVAYIEDATPAVWGRLTVPPVGVYFFDGDKSTEQAARDGLDGVVPHLADRALIILDDGNAPQIRAAAWHFCREHRRRAFVALDMPTPANCWGSWWDGVIVIAWGYDIG